jgi:hypothetical protein
MSAKASSTLRNLSGSSWAMPYSIFDDQWPRRCSALVRFRNSAAVRASSAFSTGCGPDKGNIVRSYTRNYPEKSPTPAFMTSFPALQGASGASILVGAEKKEFAVCGMIVRNVEAELRPAQVVRLFDGEKVTEASKYFLPYGETLNRLVVLDCLSGMGITFSCYAG